MSDNQKVALITGITGQDGSYLAELLLEKGYEVSQVIGVSLCVSVYDCQYRPQYLTHSISPMHYLRDRSTALSVGLLVSILAVLNTFTRTVTKRVSNSSCITVICAMRPI